jgi:hypothetical protein
MSYDAIIWTEGKTDWLHFQRAHTSLKIKYDLSCGGPESAEMGDDKLLKQCRALALVQQARPTIFIFDRDKPEIVSQVVDEGLGYKPWGNNVFSLAIPLPAHRTDAGAACMELYYRDDEIKTVDETGRRLFLSSEFNSASGRHITDHRLSVGHKGKLPPAGTKAIRIIDSDVYDAAHKNVAMSKVEFAAKVAAGSGKFGDFDFAAFTDLFSIIELIVTGTNKTDFLFEGMLEFTKGIEDLETPAKLGKR